MKENKMKKKLLPIVSLLIVILAIFFLFAQNINASDSLEEKDETLIELENIVIENEKNKQMGQNDDLLALTILKNYNKVQDIELIKDWDIECELMNEICDMLENNVFNEEEEIIMKNYLDRRYSLLIDFSMHYTYNQEALQDRVEKILGYDHWEN